MGALGGDIGNMSAPGLSKSEHIRCFFRAFWRHLADLGHHFGPTWRQMAAQGSQNGTPDRPKSMPKSMQKLMTKKSRKKYAKIDLKMMQKLINNRYLNRLEREKTILQKVLFFQKENHTFWGSKGPKSDQQSIENRFEIQARKSDAKMLPRLPDMDPNSKQNLAKNRSTNDAKNRLKKDFIKIWKLCGTTDQKSNKNRKHEARRSPRRYF